MTDRRLLVIDDDRTVADLVRRVAERRGFETLVIYDPHEFKRLWESFDPEVILLDIVMPEVDGVELLRYLADEGCGAHIILISGYQSEYLTAAQLLGNAYGFKSIQTLMKPVDINVLRAALDKT